MGAYGTGAVMNGHSVPLASLGYAKTATLRPYDVMGKGWYSFGVQTRFQRAQETRFTQINFALIVLLGCFRVKDLAHATP